MHYTTLRLDHDHNKNTFRNFTYDVSTEEKNTQQNKNNSEERIIKFRTNRNERAFLKLEQDYQEQRNVLKRYLQERGYYLSKSTKMLNDPTKDQELNAHYQTHQVQSSRKIKTNDDIEKQFLPQLNEKTRFYKPYLQNTKYVDLLVKNKRLIRRGLFDMPVENLSNSFKRINKRPIKEQSKPISEKSKVIYHYSSLPKKLNLRFTQQKESSKSTKFNSTVENSEQYKCIYKKDQINPVQYQNSLNRMIAMENVREKLLLKNHKRKIMIRRN